MKPTLVVGLLAFTAFAQDGDVYRHPGGYFTIRPAEGWTVKSEAHAADLSKRNARLIILVAPRMLSNEAAMDEKYNSLASGWDKLQQTGTDQVTIAGSRVTRRIYFGTGGETGSAFVRLTAVSFPPHTIVMVGIASSVAYLTARDEMARMEQSLAPGTAAQQKSTPLDAPGQISYFSDPAGRYRVAVPPGWSASEAEGGARITSGNAYVNVMVLPGNVAPPAIVSQISRQWRDFREFDNGPMRLGNTPATYVTYTGTNPRGVPAVMKTVSAASSAGTFLLLMSAPQNEADSRGPAFQQIERGFVIAVAAGKARSSDDPPGADFPSLDDGRGASPIEGPIAQQMGGSSDRPILGVHCRDLTPEDMATVAGGASQGALVMQVGPGTPAERAGIRQNDVIVAIANQPVMNVRTLIAVMGSRRSGETIDILVARQGRPMNIRVLLGGGSAPSPGIENTERRRLSR